MRRAVIVDIVRSPFGRGREGGALTGLHPVDLYAQTLKGLLKLTQIDPALVEDVITGCVIQVGEQAGNIGRQAVLAAGMPESVPALTLDRKCGSAQQAVDFAAQGVIAGAYDVVIAGGVEMMSLVPMKLNRMGRDSEGPMYKQRYSEGSVNQGIAAELIAANWGLSRADMDRYSERSHVLAAQTEDSGILQDRIIPVTIPADGETLARTVTQDEGIRRDTSFEKLQGLKPAYQNNEMAARFPQINWTVTAGNTSQITDGSCAALIMEEQTALKLGLKPRAAITHFALGGVDPIIMLTGVIPATEKLLHRANLSIHDIDLFEVNEAFASVPLAWAKEFNIPHEKLNIYGGAIALGHPVGASGGRLMSNLITALEQTGGRYGLQTMCESGGMANATLIERL